VRHDAGVTIGAESRREEDARRLGWYAVPLVLAECRPIVLVMFALRFVAGASLGTAGGWGRFDARDWPHVVIGLLAWVCATAAVYLYNGISDLPGDRLNGSTRPLASGRLPLRVAVAWCVGFAVASVVLGAVLGLAFAASVLASLLIGWWYSAGRLAAKRRVWSACVVIGLGGLITYLAGLYSAGGTPDASSLSVVVLLSLWMATAGNTKDLGDIEGDRSAGRRTLPVVLGMRGAAWTIAVACCLVGVAGLAVPLPAGRIVAGCFVVAGLVMLAMVIHGRDLGSKRRMYAVFMVSQLVANLIVVVA
jgi:4-hydroxybenzoate polyprenyltransferase